MEDNITLDQIRNIDFDYLQREHNIDKYYPKSFHNETVTTPILRELLVDKPIYKDANKHVKKKERRNTVPVGNANGNANDVGTVNGGVYANYTTEKYTGDGSDIIEGLPPREKGKEERRKEKKAEKKEKRHERKEERREERHERRESRKEKKHEYRDAKKELKKEYRDGRKENVSQFNDAPLSFPPGYDEATKKKLTGKMERMRLHEDLVPENSSKSNETTTSANGTGGGFANGKASAYGTGHGAGIDFNNPFSNQKIPVNKNLLKVSPKRRNSSITSKFFNFIKNHDDDEDSPNEDVETRDRSNSYDQTKSNLTTKRKWKMFKKFERRGSEKIGMYKKKERKEQSNKF